MAAEGAPQGHRARAGTALGAKEEDGCPQPDLTHLVLFIFYYIFFYFTFTQAHSYYENSHFVSPREFCGKRAALSLIWVPLSLTCMLMLTIPSGLQGRGAGELRAVAEEVHLRV